MNQTLATAYAVHLGANTAKRLADERRIHWLTAFELIRNALDAGTIRLDGDRYVACFRPGTT